VALVAQIAVKVASKIVIAQKVPEKHRITSKLSDPKWEAMHGCPLSRTSVLARPRATRSRIVRDTSAYEDLRLRLQGRLRWG
jgi:hypothetical protein